METGLCNMAASVDVGCGVSVVAVFSVDVDPSV
jgi:hypothetical protein